MPGPGSPRSGLRCPRAGGTTIAAAISVAAPTGTFTRKIGPSRREARLVTKRIQGARGYAQLRKQDVDRRFPGLLDSILNADAATRL